MKAEYSLLNWTFQWVFSCVACSVGYNNEWCYYRWPCTYFV